jgi:hypothetical protein
MAKINPSYKKPHNFRAGIEAGVSALKKAFGFFQISNRGFRIS